MKKGYIAITTSIILSLLMTALALSLGASVLSTRLGVADFSSKRMSFFAARSCAELARLKLAENLNYAGNASTTVDIYQCSILPIETSGQNKIIKAKAQVNGATTNLKLTVNTSTLSTVSLEELANF